MNSDNAGAIISEVTESRAALLMRLNSNKQYQTDQNARGAYLRGWIAAEGGELRTANPYKTRSFKMTWDRGFSAFRKWQKQRELESNG